MRESELWLLESISVVGLPMYAILYSVPLFAFSHQPHVACYQVRNNNAQRSRDEGSCYSTLLPSPMHLGHLYKWAASILPISYSLSIISDTAFMSELGITEKEFEMMRFMSR